MPIHTQEHADGLLPLASRLNDALEQLRWRVEQQWDRQQQLQLNYRSWQRNCSSNCLAMERQLTILEGLLRAWMPRGSNDLQLSVVSESPESN